MKIGTRLFSIFVLMELVAISVGCMGLYIAKISHDGLDTVYKDRVVPLEQLKVVSDMYAVDIADTSQKVLAGAIDWEEARKQVADAQSRIFNKWKAYLATYLVPDEKGLVVEITPLMKKADAAVDKLNGILLKHDRAALARFTTREFYPAIDPLKKKLSGLVAVQLVVAEQEYLKSEDSYRKGLLLAIILVVVGSFLSGVLAIQVIRHLLRELGGEPAYVLEIAQTVADGDLSVAVIVDDDKKGSVLWGIRIMVESLREHTRQLEDAHEKLEAYVAEIKQAELTLRQSEHFLNTLLNAIPVPVFYKDREGRYLGFNKAYETFFGATRDQLIDKSVFDISPPELAKIYHAKDTELFESRGMQQYESQVKNTQGMLRDVIFSKAVFSDSQGVVSGLIGAILDITERKQAEQALAENERKYRELFESSRDALMVLRPPSWRYTDANRATLQMFGAASMADFTELGPWDVSPERQPDGSISAEAAQEMIATAMREGSSFFEWEHQRLNGEPFSADVLLTRIEAGGQVSVQATVRDISERKHAENQLRQALLYARSLIEADMDPLMTINVAGKIMVVNRAAIQMTGVPRELMTGSDFSTYFTEPDKAQAGYQEAFAKGYVRDFPLTMRHASGGLTEVLLNASVYRNENGEMAGVLAVARDISERLRAEQAEEQASRDGLTGLYNHRTFYSLLKDEIFRTQRSNRPLSLLMLDIDYFKRINDTHGHQAGDVILRDISDLLLKQARTIDRVCRYGGEEITVILPETDATEAMKIAERLCAAVELQSFDIGDGKTVGINVSIGVATYPQQANSPEALVKAADVALYSAKQGGRNRVCCFGTDSAGKGVGQ